MTKYRCTVCPYEIESSEVPDYCPECGSDHGWKNLATGKTYRKEVPESKSPPVTSPPAVSTSSGVKKSASHAPSFPTPPSAEPKGTSKFKILLYLFAILLIIATWSFRRNIFNIGTANPATEEAAKPGPDIFYTYADVTSLLKKPDTSDNPKVITTLPFGSKIIIKKLGSPFTYCKANGKKGYVATTNIFSYDDFLLFKSIFGDSVTLNAIKENRYRKAMFNYFKEHEYIGKTDSGPSSLFVSKSGTKKEQWQLFTNGKKNSPNSIAFVKIHDPKSSFNDFAVIITNIETKKRKLLVFYFRENEYPVLFAEKDAPMKGNILKIKRKKINGTYKYYPVYDKGEK